ncbi:hypothetical protein [Microbacterium sp.]|uniref:hypothetical protein n=1 Tax=Microbacterium sp. TaxID=51671 RepID=UPI003A8C00B7
MKLKKASIAICISVGLVIASALPAAAAQTHNISASLNCAGALFESSTYRWHPSGNISLRLTAHHWWWDVWTLRSGMRNQSGNQITHTMVKNPESRTTSRYRLSSNNSMTIPRGYYAMNLRVGNTAQTSGCRVWPPSFEGKLTL